MMPMHDRLGDAYVFARRAMELESITPERRATYATVANAIDRLYAILPETDQRYLRAAVENHTP